MANDEVWVDFDGAFAGGDASVEAAANLRDIPEDFDDLVSDIESVLDGPPTVGGWGGFKGDNGQHMHDVRKHAEDAANKINEGAWDIAVADLNARESYQEGDLSLPQSY